MISRDAVVWLVETESRDSLNIHMMLETQHVAGYHFICICVLTAAYFYLAY